MGDYTGFTGLERTYEKVLMGERGIKRFVRDNRSRIQGPYENGRYDTAEVAGKNLHLSLDITMRNSSSKIVCSHIQTAHSSSTAIKSTRTIDGGVFINNAFR